jgi:hypothetical protein
LNTETKESSHHTGADVFFIKSKPPGYYIYWKEIEDMEEMEGSEGSEVSKLKKGE